MDLIKLPIDLGLKVLDILKKSGYQPRINSLGIISLEFTQEELNQITELTFINPPANCLAGIEHLKNLQKLIISTNGSTAYSTDNTSITDKDIQRIAKLTSLTSLTINNQRDISWVYLDHLENLKELTITKNAQIDEISGLDKLKKLTDFCVYGNKNLYQLTGIVDLIKDNELDFLELDLMNYPEVESLKSKLLGMVNCSFCEASSSGRIAYTTGQASLFHKKCTEIANTIQNLFHNQRAKIIAVEKYLAENVRYDYEGLKSDERVFYENGNKRGKRGGTNSAYNGIMYGACVCEGYTRSMQYLLKLMGIKTENVRCISGSDKIKINTNYHNTVSLPNDGYHSIIRIDDEYMLYCDPCWDACYWQKGNQTLPYCLLTKKEISKDHTLSFEENIVDNNHLVIPREHIKEVLNGMQELFIEEKITEASCK